MWALSMCRIINPYAHCGWIANPAEQRNTFSLLSLNRKILSLLTESNKKKMLILVAVADGLQIRTNRQKENPSQQTITLQLSCKTIVASLYQKIKIYRIWHTKNIITDTIVARTVTRNSVIVTNTDIPTNIIITKKVA